MRKLLLAIIKKKSGFFFLNIAQAINLGIAVVTLPIILSSIAVAAYGQWQFVLAIQALGLVISAPQITDGSKRGLTKGQEGTFFFSLVKRGGLLSISSAALLVIAAYLFFTERATLSLLFGLSAFYLFSNILIPASVGEYFIAKGEYGFWSIWQIISSPLARTGATVVAFFTHSIVGFVLFQVFYGIIISLFSLLFLIVKRKLWQHYRRGEFDEGCFRYGIRYLPVDIVGALSYKIAEVLIGTYLGFTTLAIFSVAKEIRNQISGVLKMVGPLFYAEFARQNMGKAIRRLQKNLLSIIAISVPIIILSVSLGVAYIIYFLPAEFLSSVQILLMLSIGLPFVVPLILLHTILSAHFRYRALAAAIIIPQLIEIVLIILLGSQWGVSGIAVAMVIYSFVGFLFYYIVTTKRDTFIHLVQQSKLFKVVARWY